MKTPYKTFSISQFKYFLISVQLRQLLKSLRFASSFFWWFNFFPQPPAAKVIAKKPKLGETDYGRFSWRWAKPLDGIWPEIRPDFRAVGGYRFGDILRSLGQTKNIYIYMILCIFVFSLIWHQNILNQTVTYSWNNFSSEYYIIYHWEPTKAFIG